ncbi:nicotinate-nucleotide adenylyltransferase [Peribacillus glennii]|uniref:Probable nicotinate-nucleotide adenylyltransferase n=1 Tax=Peribacillus glennii TaxID=2303991 RepID=A0A372LHL3_9BACI|nr:nicotinate-nucleotide adenylyltransferase [Peribacillus glennii]RFU65783.1 nicotinate-nucleotide adenylyltransferase [Peribacillus glennii]
MKRIGILGGTFDPPHIGHLIVANEVLNALDLDEIRFMPNHVPPHKQKTLDVTDEDRLTMLAYAIEGNDCFSIEKIEIERQGTSYTYETIQDLRQREHENEFHFIIGADMIEYLPMWHKIDELMKLIHFIGVKRPTYNEKTDYPITMVDIPEMFISSSDIRERIKKGRTIKYLLPERVIHYIEENDLYAP